MIYPIPRPCVSIFLWYTHLINTSQIMSIKYISTCTMCKVTILVIYGCINSTHTNSISCCICHRNKTKAIEDNKMSLVTAKCCDNLCVDWVWFTKTTIWIWALALFWRMSLPHASCQQIYKKHTRLWKMATGLLQILHRKQPQLIYFFIKNNHN